MFEDKYLCSKCGGHCCLNMPGCCFPQDFDNDIDKITKALNSEMYCIDWWEGDPRPGCAYDDRYYGRGYYLRPATKKAQGILYDGSWGGECVFLGCGGCGLGADSRPLQCQALKPGKDGNCKVEEKYSKQASAVAWLRYYDFLDSFEKSLDMLNP